MLALVGWVRGLNLDLDGIVNSLTCKKPKNANEKAAVSMRLSCLWSLQEYLTWYKSLWTTARVIGCLGCEALLRLACCVQDHPQLGIVRSWILKPLTAVKWAYCWKIHLYGGGWETSAQCCCKIDQCMLVCREWLHSMFHAKVEESLYTAAVGGLSGSCKC